MAFDTTIMPVKVLDANGSGAFDVISDGIIFATDQGADLITMSLGSAFDAQVMDDAVKCAFANGVLVVTSDATAFSTVRVAYGPPTLVPRNADQAKLDEVAASRQRRLGDLSGQVGDTGPLGEVESTEPLGDAADAEPSGPFRDIGPS